jgi:hypothetical protein
MVRQVFHLFHRSFRSLWENAYLNSVAVGVIGASTLLLGVYLTVQFNLNQIVDHQCGIRRYICAQPLGHRFFGHRLWPRMDGAL